MKLSTKRFIELIVYFSIGLIILTLTTTGFYAYAGIVTGINILYIIMAKTVLPTLKHTVPNFFGNFVALTTEQLLHCFGLCIAVWAPAALIIGGAY